MVDYITVNAMYYDVPNDVMATSYDFNPLQLSRLDRIASSHVQGDFVPTAYPYQQMPAYPFDGLPPSCAPLALDLLQSQKNDTDPSYIGQQSHPGDWNVLCCDGSVAKVHDQALLRRQTQYAVLGSTPDWWAEYDYEIYNYIINKSH